MVIAVSDGVPGTRETTKIEIITTAAVPAAARVAEGGLPPYRSYVKWLYWLDLYCLQ